MRVKIMILSVAILFCFLPGYAWADSAEAIAITKTKVGIIQDLSEHSQVTTIEKRPHIFVPPGTGTFVLPPSTLDEGGWKNMMYEPLLKEFTYEDLRGVKIKNMGLWRSLTQNYLKKTVFRSRVAALQKKYIDKVTRLDWYHTGNPEVGEVSHPGDMLLGEYEVSGQKDWTTIAPLLLGILDAMEETYAKRIVVQPKLKKEAYNKGLSFGSGTAAGVMMGPSGAADNKAGFISLGGLIGVTWAGVWSMYDFRILALNDGPIEPPANWWKLVLKPKPEEKAKPELDELNRNLGDLKQAIKDLAQQAGKPAEVKIPEVKIEVKSPELKPGLEEQLEEMKKKLSELQNSIKELAAKKVVPPKLVKPKPALPKPAAPPEKAYFEFKGEFKGEGSVK